VESPRAHTVQVVTPDNRARARRERAGWLLIVPIAWILATTSLRIANEEAHPNLTDESGYFAWVWSWLADRDVDPTNQMSDLGVASANFPQWQAHADGRSVRVNKFSTGVSLAILPVAAPTHAAAHASHRLFGTRPVDQFDLPLLVRASWAAAGLWACAGLVACYLVARRLTSPASAIVAVLGAWAGTSAFAYSWKLSLYAHGIGMSTIAIATYLVVCRASARTIAWGSPALGVATGAMLGLSVTVRPTNLIALLPAILILAIRWAIAFKGRPQHAGIFALACAIGASGPLGVEAYTRWACYGSAFFNGYASEKFTWSAPHWAQVLGYFKTFDGQGMGLLAVHPLTMPAIAGLLIAAWHMPRRRGVAGLSLASVVGLVYLYSSWDCWYLGDSFGARWAADLLVVWTIGLALFVHQTSSHPRRAAIYVAPLSLWSIVVSGMSVGIVGP
jgi:hypothetical protein